MLLPNMSLQDIRLAVMQDYEADLGLRINNLYVSYKRKWLLNNKKDLTETIAYTSKSKNNWRIVLRCSRDSVHAMPYLIAYNTIGITASHVTAALTPIAFMHFNTHFFKRFKERMQLDISKPEQVVKDFFKKNLYMIPYSYPLDDGKEQIFTLLKGGIGLGIYHEEDDIFEFKTFVDNSLLGPDQHKKIHDIATETIERLEEAKQKKKGKKG